MRSHNPSNVKTLDDLALSDIILDDFPFVMNWRKKLFSPEGRPEICDELPRLLTEYIRENEGKGLSDQMLRAGALHNVFKNKKAIVTAEDLLPGRTTTSFVGPVVYVDTIGLGIWPELKTVANRAKNPFQIKPAVAKRLNREIFPFWINRNVQEKARYSKYDSEKPYFQAQDIVDGGKLADGRTSIDPPLKKKAGEIPKCQELMERIAFYLSDKATCVSHTVADFDRLLRFGLEGLTGRIREDLDQGKAAEKDQQEFLRAVILTFEGAMTYAGNLAKEAKRVGNAELEKICKRVPTSPAETLHEALVSIWICYHLLLQENTNFGFSIARLDQLLNPYYLADIEKLSGEEEKEAYIRRAVELICHFFLHCSDHVPLSTEASEVLFAGSGSNQALTVGGTNYINGEVVDAVNDMTYIILKTTEMLAIRDPNVHARYHKEVHNRDAEGKPLENGDKSSYLLRISQVNITTRATPAIHGDVPVANSMAAYYRSHEGVDEDTAQADAHDYASIGCIEENAAAKHYGNTGSTLMVLPAVLELSIFGGKHRNLGLDKKAPNVFEGLPEYTTKPLTDMNSMDEFIGAFRKQLDDMARHNVQANNYYGRTMAQMRQCPFLSGLFVGPTPTPEDPMASYRDVSWGGAFYNSAGVAVIGLADVIDSFCVIDSLVFGGRITAQELVTAMKADFVPEGLPSEKTGIIAATINWFRNLFGGNGSDRKSKMTPQRLQQIISEIRSAPRYGAGVDQTPGGKYNNALAVKYSHLLPEIIQEVYYKYRTHRGGRYLVGYWSMTNHAGFGMLTKATPNGRHSGAPFASGITPGFNLMKGGTTKVTLLDHLASVTAIKGEHVQNGYTYNLSITRRGKDELESDTELLADRIKAFMDNDGVLVQLCVSSVEELEAAHNSACKAEKELAESREPDPALMQDYQELMIRVAGYSAYFVTLSPEMRQEIIARSNFALLDGAEQHPQSAI